MLREDVFALVPVSEIGKAKSRLNFLTREEREELVLAMLSDVLSVVEQAKINAVVISPSDFSEACGSYGFYFIRENRKGKNLNRSVDIANKFAIEKGAKATIFIPADMPLISKKDVDEFLHHAEKYNVVISRANDAGTGLLLRKPCDIIPTFFGKNSFEKHLRYAEEKGISIKVVCNERVSFDIDEKEDLLSMEMFLKFGRQKNIYKAVERLWRRC